MIVTLAKFPPHDPVTIDCYHLIIGEGSKKFDSYTATTDSSGASTTTHCVWNQPDTHMYVIVTAPDIAFVGSNHFLLPA